MPSKPAVVTVTSPWRRRVIVTCPRCGRTQSRYVEAGEKYHDVPQRCCGALQSSRATIFTPERVAHLKVLRAKLRARKRYALLVQRIQEIDEELLRLEGAGKCW